MKPIPFNALAKLLGRAQSSQVLVRGFAIDSRKVRPGDLFFALPGERVDGHTFLQEVAKKGACGAIVHKSYRGDNFSLPLLVVPDVVAALQDLGRKVLEKRKSKVVAITGSLGKTTTKEFTKTLLESFYPVFASPSSYNSQVTLPLSILMAEGNEEILVLEMGMSEPGQIEQLVSIAPPDVALVTTAALQHVDHFPDGLAAIAREKASIFAHPKTQIGLLCEETPYFQESFRVGSCQKKVFSLLNPKADFFMEVKAKSIVVHAKGEAPYELAVELPMKAFYQNLLAALSIARLFDVPWSCLQEALTRLKLPAMRFERVEKEGIVFINDAYNANPDSMKAALASLPAPRSGGKTIAVLGHMDALGSYTEEGHASVARTALNHADLLLCLGGNCETMKKIWQIEKRAVEIFDLRADLEHRLKELAKPGDVVLLKGARVFALDQILKQF